MRLPKAPCLGLGEPHPALGLRFLTVKAKWSTVHPMLIFLSNDFRDKVRACGQVARIATVYDSFLDLLVSRFKKALGSSSGQG